MSPRPSSNELLEHIRSGNIMNYYRDQIENIDGDLRLLNWDKRIDIGQHESEKDEPAPEISTDYDFCCSNGCGECKPVPMQFFSYLQTDSSGKIIDARYNKTYTPDCCRNEDSYLQVYDVLRGTLVGGYESGKFGTPEQCELVDVCEDWKL